MPTPRSRLKETLHELASELAAILPSTARRYLSPKEALKYFARLSKGRYRKPRAAWDAESGRLVAFVFDKGQTEPCGGAALALRSQPDEYDEQVAQGYARVFNGDLGIAHDVLAHRELWQTLCADRFTRAIARASAFHTAFYRQALAAMEAATHLRYEGAAFEACVFLTKQIQWLASAPGVSLHRFKKPLSFRQTLLHEKWIRQLSDGSNVGLVALGHGHGFIGVATIPPATNNVFGAPHTDLSGAISLVRHGVNAFLSAPNGDFFVVQRQGYGFLRTQGTWQYLSFNALRSLLAENIAGILVDALLRLVLDLSFSRTGALFCILDNEDDLPLLVPDNKSRNETNAPLRHMARGLRLTKPAQVSIIRSIAGIDGAIVLSSAGRVLDVACMIAEPDAAALKGASVPHLRRFSGARATAAWNCSLKGVAIKVSEDGPIEIYRSGRLVGTLR